jgi:predicted RNA-binding Zn-ribbon protein involved in translation (DUF1610 family)
MSIVEYAYRAWFCASCAVECRMGNREVDNFDLVCPECGRAYVIVAGDAARPAGA